MALFEEMDSIGSKSYGKYLAPGINSGVTVGPITYVTDSSKPYIDIVLYRSNSTPEQGKSFRLYMSDNARKKSLEKLIHMVTKVMDRKELDQINSSAKSVEEFVAKIDAVLNGVTFTYFKLCAEEYLDANNEIKRRLSIGLPSFASMASTVEESKLKYSETNIYDYKPLSLNTEASTSSTIL